MAGRLDLMRQRAHTEYLRKQFAASATRPGARYDEQIAKFVPSDQVRASHILVKTEDEAKAIIAELDKGATSPPSPRENRSTPVGARGGDLGFFGKGMMVKPFEDAAFSTPVGTYTKTPIKSDFGWHIIRSGDPQSRRRPSKPRPEPAGPDPRDLREDDRGAEGDATIESCRRQLRPAAAPAPAPARRPRPIRRRRRATLATDAPPAQ